MKQHNSALRATFPQQRVLPFLSARMQGAVSIEYALVASLIALVIVVGFVVVGTSLGTLYGRLAACFVNPASCMGGAMNPGLTHALWFAVYALMLVAAVWRDAAVRRIPNRVVLFGTVAAMVLSVLPGGTGFGNAVAGLVAGLVVPLPFYLLRVMGAGDVKLLAAVGAFVGFPGVFGVVLVTFLAGGLMSLAWAIRFRTIRAVLMNLRIGLSTGMGRVAGGSLPRDGDFPLSGVRVPYALAIATGAVAHVLLTNKFGWKNVF